MRLLQLCHVILIYEILTVTCQQQQGYAAPPPPIPSPLSDKVPPLPAAAAGPVPDEEKYVYEEDDHDEIDKQGEVSKGNNIVELIIHT